MTTKTRMRPIGDHIVVKPEDAEDTTPGGIVLPEAAKDKPTRGRVIAVGSGQLLRDGSRAKMEVEDGDTVVYSRYGGTEIEIEEQKYVVLREQDVLLVL